MARRGSASSRREEGRRKVLSAAGVPPGVTGAQIGQAALRQLEMEKAALIRHVEHQRCVMAIMLRRLGGTFAIHDTALLRSVQQYDVEVGNRAPLVMPDPADKDDVPQPQKGPIVFRLIDKQEQRPVEAALQALPQRVLDLLEAADAAVDNVFAPSSIRDALIEWLAQEPEAQTPEDLAERLGDAPNGALDDLAEACTKLHAVKVKTNHEDNDTVEEPEVSDD